MLFKFFYDLRVLQASFYNVRIPSYFQEPQNHNVTL
jgi:hypothetical protein